MTVSHDHSSPNSSSKRLPLKRIKIGIGVRHEERSSKNNSAIEIEILEGVVSHKTGHPERLRLVRQLSNNEELQPPEVTSIWLIGDEL